MTSAVAAKTLMHPIEAQNHRNNGYFPTDKETMTAIALRLNWHDKPIQVLDPCCGCGQAVSLFKLDYNANITGVELDEERAEQARSSLDQVYLSNIYDAKIARSSVDVLFLNPPYGRTLTDKMDENSESKRIEHQFLTRSYPALKAGGLMIYIVPFASLDEKRQKWFLANFSDVCVFPAATQRYKQVVVMGQKRKYPAAVLKQDIVNFQSEIAHAKNCADSDRKVNVTHRYDLLSSNKPPVVTLSKIDKKQLAEFLQSNNKHWQRVESMFSSSLGEFEQPLHALSDWHLALMITSGAMSGIVDNGQRRLIVKGRTRKIKVVSERKEKNEGTGDVTSTIEKKDRFVTVINAIDITPGSKKFGDIVVIK